MRASSVGDDTLESSPGRSPRPSKELPSILNIARPRPTGLDERGVLHIITGEYMGLTRWDDGALTGVGSRDHASEESISQGMGSRRREGAQSSQGDLPGGRRGKGLTRWWVSSFLPECGARLGRKRLPSKLEVSEALEPESSYVSLPFDSNIAPWVERRPRDTRGGVLTGLRCDGIAACI